MKPQERRAQILQEIARIDRMERGRLTAEYRETVRNGKTVRTGPYFKHQRWEDGRNQSRRVPAAQAEQLRSDVEAYHHFETLSREYAQITIEMTREADTSDDTKKKP